MNDWKNQIIIGDCLSVLGKMKDDSVDVVVTSPPYNLDIKYKSYQDNRKYNEYLLWLEKVFNELYRVMSDKASFFLNIGFSSKNPWLSWDVAKVAQKCKFHLQNNIVWVKSISVNGNSYGHFKPLNSERYINNMFEMIYHFTKTGDVKLDRLSIGVPYQHKSNVTRWKEGNGIDLRCRGNTWFIPYETIVDKKDRGEHPATFPIELPLRCIKLHGVQRTKMVMDPFLGIGSTLLASNKLEISGIGIEIDESYVGTAIKFLQNAGAEAEVIVDEI